MDVVTYKCPNCGAPLAFDIPSQRWECHFCMSGFDKSESEKFERQGDAGETQWTAENYDEAQTAVYTCPSCGGEVIADQNTAATFCAFCHSPTVMAGRLKGEYRPARIIPFKLPKEEAVKALQKLCKGRPLLPREFRDSADKGEVTGLYVPFWLFSADVDASMTAKGTRVSTWSDANYRYTKTDIYHIQREGTIPYRKMPVDASSRMDDRLMDGLEPYSYDDLEPFAMEYLSGHFAENFDVDSKSCFSRFSARAESGAQSALRSSIGGYTTVTGEQIATRFRGLDTLYVMLPVWTLMIPFKGKTYTFAMNGQTGKIVGKLPLSFRRVAQWFGMITGIASLIFFLGGLLV